MRFLQIIALVIFISSCNSEEDIIAPKLDEYDLEVISYFKEIALGFEFGSSSKITRKWCSDLKVFIGGETNSILLEELDNIISEILSLSTDNFNMEIVSDSSLSNYYIFFGKGDNYAKIFPSASSYVNNNWGLFFIWYNSSNCLNRGQMYVDTDRADFIQAKHLLREEFTQSLGLARDSDKYINSIFQSSWTTTTSFSQIDKDLIRLLYHPEMQTGLNESEVDVLLRNVILNEK
tara:strand:- start:1622 stop:2323 length:702 start_codon:yes stop_codon:yes gene_type:complete